MGVRDNIMRGKGAAADGASGALGDHPFDRRAVGHTGAVPVNAPLDFHKALVRAILERPFAFDWTLQGLGMLRTYLGADNAVRMHVWDSDYAVPGVSQMHTHPWDFASRVAVGAVHQMRYLRHVDGSTFGDEVRFVMEQSLRCGAGGGLEAKPERLILHEQPVEVYYEGETYTQAADEIHVSIPADGTVTLIERVFRPDTEHAFVFWPQGEEWVSAEPRPATPEEVRRICERSLDRWYR